MVVVVLFVEDTIIAFTTVHQGISTTDVESPIYVLSAAGSPRLLVEQFAAGGERWRQRGISGSSRLLHQVTAFSPEYLLSTGRLLEENIIWREHNFISAFNFIF